MNRSEAIDAAITTFCRMNGIDPTSNAVTEFRCAMLSEVSGALIRRPGFAETYAHKHGVSPASSN